jgi:DNA excision repair protein ERCC-2
MTTEPESTKKTVKVAIRTLVEQFYRSGDLGIDFAGTARAVEGTAAHRKLQKARPEGYRAEVPVSLRIDTPNFILELTGRLDGVLETTEPVTIEEFKTTLLDLDIVVAEENPAHWAQLKLYGYCYVIEHGLEQVTGQLTYYSPGTGELRELPRTFDLTELKTCFDEIIGRYLAWANAREE